MDPVSALGLAASIIAVIQLAGALLKPATSSLGPSENDVKELKRLQTTMTGLQVAYDNLEQYLTSNPGCTAETLITALQQPILDCKAVVSELERRLSRITFVRKHITGRKWDKEFKNLVKRLDDARQLFDVILQGDQSERLVQISQFMTERSKDIEQLGQLFSEMRLTVQTNQRRLETQEAQNQSELRSKIEGYQQKIDIQEQRKLKEEILRWLTIVDPRSNHDSAYASHKPGTGDWFTKGKSFRNWLTEPKSFFWLNGKAGCGKTVLSSTIIENTNTYCNENEGCVMAYFYFSFTDAAKQQCSNMLSSLLTQIASQVDLTPDCLASLHRAYQRSNPPKADVKRCLHTLFNETPIHHVYVLIDALDEIPDTDGREEACKILEELSQHPKVHILTTSRREHDITEYMSECNSITDISIQNSEVDHDIQLYVRERLKADKKLKKWSTLHSEIERVLSAQADGMFRWAACQLDTLKKCLTANAVRNALKSLPKTLDETYERILLAIDENYQDMAIEALRWLCFSAEVLTIEKLAEAAVFSATVQPPSKDAPFEVSFDIDDRIQDPLDILCILSGLVVYRTPRQWDNILNDNLPENARTTSEILLSHFSVKEYLVSDRLRNQVERFAIDEGRAHETLATRCLYYILYSQQFLEFYMAKKSSHLRRSHEIILHPSSPIFPYALENWVEHARNVDYESELTRLILAFLEAEPPLQWCLIDSLSARDKETSQALTPIYLASSLDLYWPCKELVETGANVNARGGYYGNALQAAGIWGNESIVRLLLDHGADVNIQGGRYGNALQAACIWRNERIVRLVLDHEANVNIQGGYYGNALQAACIWGTESIVRLVLDHGANVNLNSGFYRSALQAALSNSNESIVRLLLEYGADVNIQGAIYGNALDAAMSGEELEHSRMAFMLLEHGAVVSEIRGGTEAEEALARKDFEGFFDIQQIELRNERRKWMAEGKKKENERRKKEGTT